MRWFVDEAAVAQRAFLGGSMSSSKVCELVSFMDYVIDGYSFIGILYAFFLVITSFALTMTASIPRPDSKMGKIGFFLWTCCVVLSYLFVLMSLVSFVTANASASALYADCLAEGTTKYKLFNLVGIFSGAFHPFVISCLCLMMMYTVLLAEAYRVWKATHGEDEMKDYGMAWLTILIALFHCLWPLFNLFIWVFSLAFVFSLSFLPSFLLLASIMYAWVILLGSVHHHWAAPILNGKWKDSGNAIRRIGSYGARGPPSKLTGEAIVWEPDPEDKMESWVPKPWVEILYNVTAPYHSFGTAMNVFRKVEINDEDLSGAALAAPVLVTLLLFSLSTLATSGAHVALHVYSGHNGGELIDELYRFQYDSFTHTPRFNMRIFDLDFAKALESLPTSFQLPDLGWGPENFAHLARSQNTLVLLLSFVRCAIAVVFFALQTFNFVNPNIGTADAASGRNIGTTLDIKVASEHATIRESKWLKVMRDRATEARSESGRGRAEKFEESDKVEANYKGKGKYYPGKISRCRLNGTYDITFDDGERESGVEAEMIRSRDDGGGGGELAKGGSGLDPFMRTLVSEYKLQSEQSDGEDQGSTTIESPAKAASMASSLARQIHEAKALADRLEACPNRPTIAAGGAAGKVTSRSKFRQTLDEVVGPAPAGRSWKEDLSLMAAEDGVSFEEKPHPLIVQGAMSVGGFSKEDAEVLSFLCDNTFRKMMAKAIAEGSNRYAAITHAVYDVLAAKASKGGVAPTCYCHLQGLGGGLADADRRWLTIDKADDTGFKGLTSHGALFLRLADVRDFSPAGIVTDRTGTGTLLYTHGEERESTDCTVVCFESAVAEDNGTKLHTAVHAGEGTFSLPPLTLLEVVREQGPNEWDYMPPWVRWKVQFDDGSIAMIDPALVPGQAPSGEIVVSVPADITLAGSVHTWTTGTYKLCDEFHNGRPCYHMQGSGDGLHMYFDQETGTKWYLTPERGLDTNFKGPAGNIFGGNIFFDGAVSLFFVDDPAPTPDAITTPWRVYNDDKSTCTPWKNDESLTLVAGEPKLLRGTFVASKTIKTFRMNQKLITVRPTYLLPANKQADATTGASKFAGDRAFLSYGDTRDAVRGLEDITSSPPLTMEQEFARNDKWKDWQGQEFSAWQEWEYVINPVVQTSGGSGHGTRDAGRPGWTIEQFVERANEYIRKQAQTLCLDEHEIPVLTLPEVIAIRLYTGPAYQPLNSFLREVAKVGPAWRKKLAHMHQLTYSSTVLHLANGLRKLVRVNTKFVNVYRGIRGELPEAFWLKDDFGDVTATDFAFMSTSLDQQVCKHYMDTKQHNVLWEIRCSSETAEGFHSGADVSMLSQYPQEAEMLFPPLTMLKVVVVENVENVEEGGGAAGGGAKEEDVVEVEVEVEVTATATSAETTEEAAAGNHQ
jgi:hypothetical protein